MVEFTIWGHDDDTCHPASLCHPENFSINWNQGISGATFQPLFQNSDSARAIFTWIPDAAQVCNTPECFQAIITDQACPYNGNQTFSYCILVRKMSVDIGKDTAVCHWEIVTFNAMADSTTIHYLWKLNDIPAGVPLLQPSYTLQTANLAPGIHMVSIETDDGGVTVNCPGKDQVTLILLPSPQPNLGKDTLIGLWETMVLNAGLYNHYSWPTGDTSQIIHVDSTGHGANYKLIWVQVTDSLGCVGSDTIIIGFVANPGMDELNNHFQFTVHPNPSDGRFEIVFQPNSWRTVYVEIVDQQGKLIHSEQITPTNENQTYRVHAANLPEGLYFLILKTEDYPPLTKKIIIRNPRR